MNTTAQPDLPLVDAVAKPTAETLIRRAYDQSRCASHGITFEEAMASKALRIALTCTAEAIARRLNGRAA